jgi:hypothetical protein
MQAFFHDHGSLLAIAEAIPKTRFTVSRINIASIKSLMGENILANNPKIVTTSVFNSVRLFITIPYYIYYGAKVL